MPPIIENAAPAIVAAAPGTPTIGEPVLTLITPVSISQATLMSIVAPSARLSVPLYGSTPPCDWPLMSSVSLRAMTTSALRLSRSTRPSTSPTLMKSVAAAAPNGSPSPKLELTDNVPPLSTKGSTAAATESLRLMVPLPASVPPVTTVTMPSAAPGSTTVSVPPVRRRTPSALIVTSSAVTVDPLPPMKKLVLAPVS